MGNEGFNNVILTEGGGLCRETTATLNPSNDVLMRRLSRLSRSTPAEPLPDTLAADLRSIVAPNPRRRPAAVRTLKGEFLPRVVFVSADEAFTWHLPVWNGSSERVKSTQSNRAQTRFLQTYQLCTGR